MHLWKVATVALMISAASSPPARATPLPDEAEFEVLARAFAPTLVFHIDERFLPVSPLFPVDSFLALNDRAAAEALGTPADRTHRYLQLSRDQQLGQAALSYRVFRESFSTPRRLVVEYWCHYVFNEYMFRGSILPWRATDNHSNDLERVFFIVEREGDDDQPVWTIAAARRAYVIRRIVTSAGSVSANVLDVDTARPVHPPVAVLVERGSHAMAPDVDDDGLVRVGIDVNASTKFVWGIRDRGETGNWYRPARTDDRGNGARLCADAEADGETPCSPYRLDPAEPMQQWFEQLKWTRAGRDQVVGRSGWVFRWLGDVQVEELMIPPDRANADVVRKMTNRRAFSENGISIGTTVGAANRAVTLGARRAWMTPQRALPDLIALGSVSVNQRGASTATASLLGFFQLDVATKLLAGVTWSASPMQIGRGFWDLPVGVELRAGRVRIRPVTTLRRGLHGVDLSLVF